MNSLRNVDSPLQTDSAKLYILSHIFSGGYSAGYYVYIWAEVLDKDAFVAFKESGELFNQELAQSFRDNVLSVGGTGDPMENYLKFRGQEPDVSALLKGRGLN